LMTTCTYDTTERTNVTLGGFGFTDEMCVNYVHYYPRADLELCKSSVAEKELDSYFHDLRAEEGQELHLEANVSQLYQEVRWTPKRSKELEEFYLRAPVAQDCLSGSGVPLPGAWNQVPQSQGGGFHNKFAVPGRHKKNKSDLLNIANNEHKHPEGEGDLVNYALRWEERGEEPNTEFRERSRSISHSDSNWLKRKDDRMKQITNVESGQMPKRIEQHNHNMNHMMKKDALKKVENALRKRETSSAKVPLLMGLGLPVLAKRFLNSFQDDWADYPTWGIDKRSAEEEYPDLDGQPLQPTKKKRRLGSQRKRSWPLL